MYGYAYYNVKSQFAKVIFCQMETSQTATCCGVNVNLQSNFCHLNRLVFDSY